MDLLVFGHRLRHRRKECGLTLAQLGADVGKPAPYLSLLENGKREPRLSLIADLAAALSTTTDSLLDPEAPDQRSALELALERAQADPLYRSLDLPHLKPSVRLPDDVLRHLVGLFEELGRRTRSRPASPEEARKANTALRVEMRERDNYFEEIEALATSVVDAAGYPGSGAVPQRMLTDLAAHFGFTVLSAPDVPPDVRSVTDLVHRRIYIPQRDSLRTRAARSVVLQTLGHQALGHEEPTDFAEFLRQRVEAGYFAGAVLMPEKAAVGFLEAAKADRDISVEDLKEVFYVSYEMAAHRLTNLATRHLDIAMHFVRSDEQGVIWKAYENDGVPFPGDDEGAIEGSRLCRHWGTRMAFASTDKFAIHYQYTDTPRGTFWCATHVEVGETLGQAITAGTAFDDARWFRGRDTDRHSTSGCPDPSCCRRPDGELATRWAGMVWPEANVHSHVLAAMPSGAYPGVDLAEVYDFLERHGPDG